MSRVQTQVSRSDVRCIWCTFCLIPVLLSSGQTYEDLPENPAMVGEDTDGSNRLVLKEENISNMIVLDVCFYAGIFSIVGMIVLVDTVMCSQACRQRK